MPAQSIGHLQCENVKLIYEISFAIRVPNDGGRANRNDRAKRKLLEGANKTALQVTA